MNEKGLPPSLDEALAKVNPERRRFLGMLLAGAAALPLLTTTELAVSEGAFEKKSGTPLHHYHPSARQLGHIPHRRR